MEKDKFHKEAFTFAIEAKQRGAFTGEYNAEKDLWNRDIIEVVECGNQIMNKDELGAILDDLRHLLSSVIIT